MFGPTDAKQQDINAEIRRERRKNALISLDRMQFDKELFEFEARGGRPIIGGNYSYMTEYDRNRAEKKDKFDFLAPDA
jgi:hypothetical protein